jgi:flagellar motor switch protein FliN/FliY
MTVGNGQSISGGGGVAVSPERKNGGASLTLAHLPVTVQILLGSTRMQLSELMELKPGSEIGLGTSPEDPVILMVNGCRIAKGQLYILEEEGDKFGLKITEVIQSESGS